MSIYLGLGSNLGDRREHLRQALAGLTASGIEIERVSPTVESPAMLPPDASPDWNIPFLNLVVRCRSQLTPEALLAQIKQIEQQLGRKDARRWSPRPIDIDILLIGSTRHSTPNLSLPHPGLADRAFFLTPLAALAPGLELPGLEKTARAQLTATGRRIPLWMGIINITPDSFSDGGRNASWEAAAQNIESMLGAGTHILDLGAESTRPGARPLTADEEWARLEPVLAGALGKLAGDPLRPLISIDTYHAEVAARALGLGADLINDVGGLTEPAMLELAGTRNADFVAMHNLGLPADPKARLPDDRSASDQVEEWLDRQMASWSRAGVDLNRIIFDPGIGFGKNSLQSLDLLRNIERFGNKGLRLLVGHSRKSFLHGFAGADIAQRDLATIGSSMALCARGVDILRVHNVPDHVAAYRGWSHLQPG